MCHDLSDDHRVVEISSHLVEPSLSYTEDGEAEASPETTEQGCGERRNDETTKKGNCSTDKKGKGKGLANRPLIITNPTLYCICS